MSSVNILSLEHVFNQICFYCLTITVPNSQENYNLVYVI